MAAEFARLPHEIAMQLHLVEESCTICSSRSSWPVRKLLDTPSYVSLKLQNVQCYHHLLYILYSLFVTYDIRGFRIVDCAFRRPLCLVLCRGIKIK